ncbi:hypothetical protein [Nitrosophilus labii]|nr:hypothetical protein [Nitrosophilus labii]
MNKKDYITALIIFLTLIAGVMVGKFIAMKYATPKEQNTISK